MSGPTRRAVVGGVAAAAVWPTSVRAADIGALLDRAATVPPAEGVRLLSAVDPAGLPEGARLDLLTARDGLAIDAALAQLGRPVRNLWRVTPTAGAWLKGDAAAIDRDTAALMAAAAAGIRLPAPALDRTIAAIEARRATLSTPAAHASPVAPGEAAGTPASTTPSTNGEAPAPALDRLLATLRAQRATAPPPGLAHLPRGRDWYALLLRRQGAALDPVAAEARIVAGQRRLVARATALFERIGDRQGPLGDRYRRLWRDERFLFADPAALIASMSTTLAAIRRAVPAWFPTVPPWSLDVAPRTLTAAEEAAGRPGFRAIPTATTAGTYVVDVRRLRERPSWTMPSVVAHELLPGHMIQLPREALAAPHRLRIEYDGGFSEGWAIYAEALAAERGWLGDDPRVMLGHLHWLLFRTSRALADIAIHWHGKDPALVRAGLVALLGEPAYFIGFDTDLDRIALEPATRAAEATCWLALADRAARETPRTLPAWLDRITRNGRRRDDAVARS